MPWSRLHRACAVLALALNASCYTTAQLGPDAVSPLQQSGHGGELRLQTATGERIRVTANSHFRFLRDGDEWTDSVEGRDLCVNARAVSRCSQLADPTAALAWSDVRAIEVESFDGLTTYGVVLAGLVIAATVVAVVVVLSGVGPAANAVPHQSSGSQASGTRGRGALVRTDGAREGDRVATPPRTYANPDLSRAGGFPSVTVAVGATPPDATSAPRVFLPPLPASSTPARIAPLFGSGERRRSALRFLGAVEGGADLTSEGEATFGFGAGIRMFNLLELVGGARALDATGGGATPQETSAGARWVGFGRLVLAFELDPWRRISLPIGVEGGGGQSDVYGRAVYGARVRIWNEVTLGLYPFNVTYDSYAAPNRPHDAHGILGFPTTAELSFNF